MFAKKRCSSDGLGAALGVGDGCAAGCGLPAGVCAAALTTNRKSNAQSMAAGHACAVVVIRLHICSSVCCGVCLPLHPEKEVDGCRLLYAQRDEGTIKKFTGRKTVCAQVGVDHARPAAF